MTEGNNFQPLQGQLQNIMPLTSLQVSLGLQEDKQNSSAECCPEDEISHHYSQHESNNFGPSLCCDVMLSSGEDPCSKTPL